MIRMILLLLMLMVLTGCSSFSMLLSGGSFAVKVLKETVAWFKKQIEPHDCGWMHTTIAGLNHRIKFLKKEKK
jgi:uncharacterized protein YceK